MGVGDHRSTFAKIFISMVTVASDQRISRRDYGWINSSPGIWLLENFAKMLKSACANFALILVCLLIHFNLCLSVCEHKLNRYE